MNTKYSKFFQGSLDHALYMANDRSVIMAVFKTKAGQFVQHNVIPDLQDENYTQLLKLVTVEEIEQMTRDRMESDRKMIIEMAIAEAKAQGYEIAQDVEGDFLRKVFGDAVEDDALFKFKLKAFELPLVQRCTSEELRTSLRDAATMLDMFKILIQIKELA